MNPERCAEVDRPRFIKSHAPFRFQYPQVIYIVRDGRDVAVSYYHHHIRKGWIDSETPFSSFLKKFNKGELDDFGIWGEHVTTWIKQANQLLLVRYEDLQEDAETELRRVLNFAELEVEETAVKSAVEASAFENMRRKEEDHREKTGLPDGDPTKKFMRKGKQGNWKKYFDEDTHEKFLDVNGEALKRIYNFRK
jgi:hypothetical protein